MACLQGELPDRRAEEAQTLYVDNLPEELNLKGIAQLFTSYGEICNLLSPPGAKYAFVSYKTYQEAERAILQLDGQGPLYLRVAFSRKKKPQNRIQKFVPPVDNPVDDYPASDYRYANNENSRDVALGRIVAEEQPSRFAQYPRFNRDAEPRHSVYPHDLDDTMYNPYENAGPYADTNAMWSRGCITIDKHGKRHVAFGRGYTRYDIPEPHIQVEEHLGRVYEKRRAGIYEYGQDRLKLDVGKCLNCGSMTKLKCEICGGFYCSKECQIEDWSRHKKGCRPIPSLVGDAEVMTRSSSDEQLLVPRRPTGMDLRSHGTLRRPKRSVAADKRNTAAHKASGREQSDVRDEALNNGDTAARSEIVRNGIPQMNDTTETLQRTAEVLQQLPLQRIIQNGYDTDSRDRAHPNDPRNSENAISGREAFVELGAACKLQDVQLGENSKPTTAVFNDPSGAPKELRAKSAQGASLMDQSRKDLMKIEEELAFQRDPRLQVNVENQAPIDANSPESPPAGSQGIDSVSRAQVNVEKQAPIVADSAESPPAAEPQAIAAPSYIGRTLPKDEFTNVIIIVDMLEATFWIHKESDVEDLATLMLSLNDRADGFPKVSDIKIGATYAVKYENFWHRATIVSIEPTVVFYVDYGSEEPAQSTDFRSLEDFLDILPFAIGVRIVNIPKDKPVNVDDVLPIKMISIDEYGVMQVVVQEATAGSLSRPEASFLEAITRVESTNVQESSVAPAPSVIPAETEPEPKRVEAPKQHAEKLPSLIDSLNVNDEGVIQVFVALNEMSYAVCVLDAKSQPDYQLIYEQLSIDCSTIIKPADFNPSIGEFVCGKREEYWFRGHVFSVGATPRLVLVDEARISPVQELLPMPEQYSNVCSFGAICTFVNPGSTLAVDESVQFRVTEIKETAGERLVHAVIVGSERLNNVGITLKKWKPTPEQKGIPFAELKPNTEVCITAYHSERVMFVRSLDTETLERTQRITQNVAKWAQTAPMLDGPPVVGQLVIAKYEDGNFYRAIVTKLNDEKVAVSYVDYGNRENTTIDQLRMLSDDLKAEKSCVAKVVLKDIITSEAPTKEVHRYLDILVGKEQPLFCTFEGIPSKDGVILTTVSAECVNTRINEYLTPSWQKEDPLKGTDCFMLEDFKFADLGEVGKVVKAIVLHATEPPFKYVMSPVDQEIIGHVTTVMAAKMHEYCESTKEHYIPRVGELCIAVYLGQWYRGVCLERNAKPNHAVIQFIDYGNTELVEHKDIRFITKEFVDVPGLGCCCVVKNLGIKLVNGEVPEKIKSRLDALIQLETFIDLLILNQDNGQHEVELPGVKNILIAEGLVVA